MQKEEPLFAIIVGILLFSCVGSALIYALLS